jgi:hypothetical protein
LRLGPLRQPARGFIGDDAQTVTTFTAEPMHQPARVFVSETAGFTAALADYRPSVRFQLAAHFQTYLPQMNIDDTDQKTFYL